MNIESIRDIKKTILPNPLIEEKKEWKSSRILKNIIDSFQIINYQVALKLKRSQENKRPGNN